MSEIANLPPGPYSYQTTGPTLEDPTVGGHVYLLDATGRKIASFWGKGAEKIAMATLIIEAMDAKMGKPNG